MHHMTANGLTALLKVNPGSDSQSSSPNEPKPRPFQGMNEQHCIVFLFLYSHSVFTARP